MNLYCIKDELSEYAYPIPMESDEVAIRYMAQQTSSVPLIKSSPKDFSIWRVGEFDSKTGIIKGTDPQLIIRADSIGG